MAALLPACWVGTAHRAGAAGMRPAPSQAVLTLRHRLENGGSLLFLGTRHTFDPQDPQIDELQRLVTAFRPTVALVEGGQWPTNQARPELVARFGEMAAISQMARGLGAEVRNADPPYREELDRVAQRFGLEKTKLFYVLRQVPQTVHASAETAAAQRLLAWMNSPQLNVLAGMESVLTDLPALDRAVRALNPAWADWRVAADPNLAAPLGHASMLNDIARASVGLREAFAFDSVLAELACGSRVLLAMGGGHLESMQPTFKLRLARMALPCHEG